MEAQPEKQITKRQSLKFKNDRIYGYVPILSRVSIDILYDDKNVMVLGAIDSRITCSIMS